MNKNLGYVAYGLLGVIALSYQNCGKVAFTAAATQASSTQNIVPNGGPVPPAPSCTLSSSNTPVITTLPPGVTPAMIAAICPSIGNDKQCGAVIIISDSGDSLYYTGEGPYDGSDDTVVGVLNNSSFAISQLSLNSNKDIVNFDNDGMDTYTINGTNKKVGGNAMDNTTYGGPNAYYTSIDSTGTSGTVNFINPIAAGGGTSYFSLENALSSASSCLSTNHN